MKIAAITMVYQEYRMLERWYHYYGDLIGYENLYVVSHGGDDEHRRLTPKASHIAIPRGDLSRFEGLRQQMLVHLQRSLYGYYDAVIRVDTDEFVVVDPDHHASLADALRSTDFDTTEAWFGLGMQLFPLSDDAQHDGDAPVTAASQHVTLSSIYSKAICCRRNIATHLHGAWYVGTGNVQIARFKMPKGLYLMHLKYAVPAEMAEANRIRAEMSTTESGESDKFKTGTYWADGDATSRKVLSDWRAFPEAPFDEAVEDAHSVLSTDMEMKPPMSVKGQPSRVQVRPRPFKTQLKLPDRLLGLF